MSGNSCEKPGVRPSLLKPCSQTEWRVPGIEKGWVQPVSSSVSGYGNPFQLTAFLNIDVLSVELSSPDPLQDCSCLAGRAIHKPPGLELGYHRKGKVPSYWWMSSVLGQGCTGTLLSWQSRWLCLPPRKLCGFPDGSINRSSVSFHQTRSAECAPSDHPSHLHASSTQQELSH